MTGIWAIILAAGESRRMGSPKMLLPYKSTTIIESVIENVLTSDIDKTLVVLGAHEAEIRKVTEKYPVLHCLNENFRDGMLSSVKCGFRNLPDGCSAAVVILGDQPMIGAKVINSVLRGYRMSGKKLVLPVFKDHRGHPLLIDAGLRNEVLELDEGEGLKKLIGKHPGEILEIDTVHPEILRDIDTKEDYIEELNQTL